MSRFNSEEEYLDWCDEMVTRIYYANIACSSKRIQETVKEISRKLWLAEGEELIRENPDA